MNWLRIRRSRLLARSLLVLGVALIALAVLLAVSAPSFMGGGREETIAGIPISALVVAKGFVGMLIGLAWMWRIYRAPTKSDGATWRYRDR